MKVQRYGWKRDQLDPRDRTMGIMQAAVPPPASADLRPKMPPVYDQGNLGSCTANAIAGALEYAQIHQARTHFTASRLFIYYNERVLEHTTREDAGAEIRDGIKVVAKLGAPPETDWPYNITRFASRPPAQSYLDALHYQALAYSRVPQDGDTIKRLLAGAVPVIFGFLVFKAFESPQVEQGHAVPMPAPEEEPLGGHAVLAVGYTPENVIVRNSWGPRWGLAGYFLLPWAYLLDQNLSADLWAITKVE